MHAMQCVQNTTQTKKNNALSPTAITRSTAELQHRPNRMAPRYATHECWWYLYLWTTASEFGSKLPCSFEWLSAVRVPDKICTPARALARAYTYMLVLEIRQSFQFVRCVCGVFCRLSAIYAQCLSRAPSGAISLSQMSVGRASTAMIAVVQRSDGRLLLRMRARAAIRAKVVDG